MTERHIVKAYDEELARLDRLVVEMGGLVEAQLEAALDALARHDPEAAEEVVRRDKKIDRYEAEIDAHTTAMLVLRQPMAEDLRIIVAALKLAGNLERMGDYAKNVAKRTITLTKVPLLAPATRSLKRMGEMVQEMIHEVLDAYVRRDAALADAVILKDRDVDRMHTSLFREFMELMVAEPQHISACTHLIFIAKDVERIGDHATNVAEKVHYMLKGSMPEDGRPKDDRSTAVVVDWEAKSGAAPKDGGEG